MGLAARQWFHASVLSNVAMRWLLQLERSNGCMLLVHERNSVECGWLVSLQASLNHCYYTDIRSQGCVPRVFGTRYRPMMLGRHGPLFLRGWYLQGAGPGAGGSQFMVRS